MGAAATSLAETAAFAALVGGEQVGSESPPVGAVRAAGDFTGGTVLAARVLSVFVGRLEIGGRRPSLSSL